MARKTIAIYPGTFDPMTNGHADIMLKASRLTDQLIVGISASDTKNPIFSLEERARFAQIYLNKFNLNERVKVMTFEGLLVNFAKKLGISFIVRGLRVVSDFEYEFQLACMNARLAEDIETIFLPAAEKNQFVSSRMVKEIASLGGDISAFVIPEIEQKILAYYEAGK